MSSKLKSVLVCSLFSISSAFTVNITRVPVSEPLTPLHHMLAQNRKENPRLKSGSFSINLTNNADLAYVGPIFVGTPLQGSNLTAYIYDTGSGYLTIPSSTCLTCNATFLYVKALSSTN